MESRRAGVLCAISSLPGPYGIGDLGEPAHSFLASLKALNLTVWQLLPVNMVDEHGCPYASPSAFGGEPALLSLDWFVESKLLEQGDLGPALSPDIRVNWAKVLSIKHELFDKAFVNFCALPETHGLKKKFGDFKRRENSWLESQSRFLALRQILRTPWPSWSQVPEANKTLCEYYAFLQFVFFEQWALLKAKAQALGVLLFGDIPIFVSHLSCDVWGQSHQFKLDTHFRPLVVAGAPPDQFTSRGQNWGAPVYDWDAMRATNWRWWRARIRHQLSLFDSIRIDHFRGLAAVWEIPAQGPRANDARCGQWVAGGGASLLSALKEEALRPDALIAEDLGVITPDVDRLRDQFELPTMRVMQFGLENHCDNIHWPRQYPKHCVAYTGTHDNSTTMGWYLGLKDSEKKNLHELLNLKVETLPRQEQHWALLKLVLESDADWVIIPAQDWLGLDDKARMNVPGLLSEKNWTWRLGPKQWDGLPVDTVASLVKQGHR